MHTIFGGLFFKPFLSITVLSKRTCLVIIVKKILSRTSHPAFYFCHKLLTQYQNRIIINSKVNNCRVNKAGR